MRRMKWMLMLCVAALRLAAAPEAEPFGNYDMADARWNPFADGWCNDRITNRRHEDGALWFDITGSDPYFSLIEVNRPVEEVRYWLFDVAYTQESERPWESLQLWFNLGVPDTAGAELKLNPDGKFHPYLIDLKKVLPEGTKTLVNFRFDPVHPALAGDRFGIRAIRVFSGELPPAAPTALVVPRVERAPASEADWEHAAATGEFLQVGSGAPAADPTELRWCYDDRNLYIRFHTALENVSYVANRTTRDADVYADDSIELFLQPDEHRYFQLVFNPLDTRFDVRFDVGKGQEAWDGDWQVVSCVTPGVWSGTVTIPLAELGGLPSAGPNWRVHAVRNSIASGRGASGLNLCTWGNHELINYRGLYFGGTADGATQPGLTSWGNLYTGANAAEFHGVGPTQRARIQCLDWSTGEVAVFEGLPGAATVEYRIPSAGRFRLAAEIGDAGKTAFYTRIDCEVVDLSGALAELQRAVAASRPEAGALTEEWNRIDRRVRELAGKLTASGAVNLRDYEQVKRDWEAWQLEMALHGLRQRTKSAFGVADPAYAVGWESPMRKVFDRVRGDHPPFRGNIDPVVRLSAAGNETEAVQLAVIAFAQPLSEVACSMGTWRNADGVVLPADAVELHLVDPVTTAGSRPKYESIYSGDWPEILTPNRRFDVAARSVRVVWCEFRVPSGTPAGVYRGEVRIAPAGMAPTAIGIDLTVRDFTLPVRSAFRSVMSLDETQTLDYYRKKLGRELSSEEREVHLDALSRFMLERRMAPGNIYECSVYDGKIAPLPPADRLDEYAALGLNGWCVGTITALGYEDTAESLRNYWSQHREAVRSGIAAAYAAARRHPDMTKDLYIHAFDEIYAHKFGKEKSAVLRELADYWRAEVPELKIECITRVLPELIGVVNIWCPSFSLYEEDAAQYDERRAAGDELWLYTCLGSPAAGEYPSFVLEAEAIDLRVIPWMCRRIGADGFLYYAISSWGGNPPDKPNAWPQGNWRAMGVPGYNGENVLIYPAPGVADPPYSSVRLENWRDGVEDYDYLALLAELTASARACNRPEWADALRESEALLQVPATVVTDFTHWTRDPAELQRRRDAIAAQIEFWRRELKRP